MTFAACSNNARERAALSVIVENVAGRAQLPERLRIGIPENI
jgi:hypothetical protein